MVSLVHHHYRRRQLTGLDLHARELEMQAIVFLFIADIHHSVLLVQMAKLKILIA